MRIGNLDRSRRQSTDTTNPVPNSPPMRTRLLLALLLPFVPMLEAEAQFSASIVSRNAFCGLNSGYAIAYHTSTSGNTYTYLWSNGATTQSIANLAPGTYEVLISDQTGLSQQVGVVIAMDEQQPLSSNWLVACEPGSCEGRVFIRAATELSAQPMSYAVDPPPCSPADPDTISWQGEPGAFILNLAGGTTYTVTVTDANGCVGTTTNTIDTLTGGPAQSWVPWVNVVGQVVPACGEAENGSFQLISQGVWSGHWDLIGPDGLQMVQFQQQPYIFSGLAAGTYTVRRHLWSDLETYLGYCEDVEVVIPAMEEPCTGVTGRIIHDADEDCAVSTLDLNLSSRVMTIEPGPHYAFTGVDGTFWKDLPEGDYTIEQTLVDETQTCPPAAQQPFTVDATTPLATVDFFNLSTLPHDLSVWMQCDAPVVGFATQVSVFVHNNSAFPSGEVELDLTYDAVLLDPQFSGPLDLGVIPPYATVSVVLTAQVPADVELLGDVLTYTATVSNTVTEPDLSNNTMTVDVVVVGSYDPNDKQGLTNTGNTMFYRIDVDEWLDYTVRFQNTGTAAAQTVVIRDTIDTDLSITSIEILGGSHAFTPSFGDGRELLFTFNDIDLPDSTTDMLGSQGFVSYRIKPVSTIQPGDVIENTAAIFFDFNPPILTNTVEHLVDIMGGTGDVKVAAPLRVFPNPTREVLFVQSSDAAIPLFQVIGVDGRAVPVAATRSTLGLRLDVAHLVPGVYVLRTNNGSALFVKD